ncbi:unnamed protein product [Menidia menidia]|uniref:(Atlantic silverside) hypothetical protein n=1 Tax=Menidia menidia TaxID=238744 RepID=A0A8S4AA06_9TELE|nr:unnamed protein product [Menidia menidia]
MQTHYTDRRQTAPPPPTSLCPLPPASPAASGGHTCIKRGEVRPVSSREDRAVRGEREYEREAAAHRGGRSVSETPCSVSDRLEVSGGMHRRKAPRLCGRAHWPGIRRKGSRAEPRQPGSRAQSADDCCLNEELNWKFCHRLDPLL